MKVPSGRSVNCYQLTFGQATTWQDKVTDITACGCRTAPVWLMLERAEQVQQESFKEHREHREQAAGCPVSSRGLAAQDVDAAAARFAKEQPEVGLIAAEAFKVKIVEQDSESVVINLSDPSAIPEEEPATAVEEACRRSAPQLTPGIC